MSTLLNRYLTLLISIAPATYDYTGQVDYLHLFNQSVDNYTALVEGAGARVPKQLVDTTSRTGYSLLGSKPKTPQEMACEYYQFDWEYADSPEHTSWIASSWVSSTACHTTHPIEYFL